MEVLTPLGAIQVLVDGEPYPHQIVKLEKDAVLCPDIDGRYKIAVTFIPDGREHMISCCLIPSQRVKVYGESDERFECVSFMSEDDRTKVSIGIRAEDFYYFDESGKLIRESEFDYDAKYGESHRGDYSISYKLLPFTHTSYYPFGIAWLNRCVTKTQGKIKRNDHQTSFGAEP